MIISSSSGFSARRAKFIREIRVAEESPDQLVPRTHRCEDSKLSGAWGSRPRDRGGANSNSVGDGYYFWETVSGLVLGFIIEVINGTWSLNSGMQLLVFSQSVSDSALSPFVHQSVSRIRNERERLSTKVKVNPIYLPWNPLCAGEDNDWGCYIIRWRHRMA